ncbi:DoxX family protein [Actinoplanes sp. NPDC049802]|uniref:DoxX family protein n=1 Tax=Actinoplanes sp. NPDC049802 TaxID=3154742 RepID=UPI0033C2FF06
MSHGDLVPAREGTPARVRIAVWLGARSPGALRMTLGLILMMFGMLKFVPGASPAEALVMRTVDLLTFGLIGGRAAVVGTALVEVAIGLVLISGIALRAGLALLLPVLAGMMSPLVLFPADLFPGFRPTLEAQYIIKDIVFVAAAGVLIAHSLGARLVLPGRR